MTPILFLPRFNSTSGYVFLKLLDNVDLSLSALVPANKTTLAYLYKWFSFSTLWPSAHVLRRCFSVVLTRFRTKLARYQLNNSSCLFNSPAGRCRKVAKLCYTYLPIRPFLSRLHVGGEIFVTSPTLSRNVYLFTLSSD